MDVIDGVVDIIDKEAEAKYNQEECEIREQQPVNDLPNLVYRSKI